MEDEDCIVGVNLVPPSIKARRKATKMDYSKYEKQNEPTKSERSNNWKTAIGLQQVDMLETSKYLIEIANANINGEISLDEAERFISEYYEHRPIYGR